jgi:hypothetical protein
MRPDVRMWRDTQGHTRAISEIRLVLSGTINPDIWHALIGQGPKAPEVFPTRQSRLTMLPNNASRSALHLLPQLYNYWGREIWCVSP